MSMTKTQLRGIFDAIMASEKTLKSLDKSGIANYTFNSESLTGAERRAAEETFNNFKDNIEAAISNINLESYGKGLGELALTPVQKAAAVQAAAMAVNPAGLTKALGESFGALKPDERMGMNFESADSVLAFEDVLGDMKVNLESFDGQQLQSVYYTTIALAVATSKQDEFSEAFFPLIVMGPADAFYEVKVPIDNFVKEFKHVTPRGIDVKMDAKPILKNLFNNELLTENRLRVKPFVDNDPDKFALVHDAKFGVTVNGETFNSAPYKIGAKIDIFGVTNTKADVARGNVTDFTDALDRAIALTNLYLGFKNAANKDLQAKLDLSFRPKTAFQLPAEGHNKELTANFSGKFTLNTKSTKDFQDKENADNALFGATIAGGTEYAVDVELAVTGSVRTDTGVIKLNATSLELLEIRKVSDGTVVTDLTTGDGQAIKEALEKIAVVGYDLDVAVTNSNFRKRSILLHNESTRYRHICEFRSGFNVIKPVFNLTGEDNDAIAETVEKQSIAVSAAMSCTAVGTLLGFAKYLEDLNAAHALSSALTKTQSDTVFVPFYHKEELKLKDNVDSLRSYERVQDIAAGILNNIADVVTVMGLESNYTNVFEKLRPGKRKTVVIGTDPHIARYLGQQLQPSVNASVSSNTFNLTFDTDAVIVTTCNPLMKDRIFVAFTDFDNPDRNTTPDLMSFGFGLYTPPFNREVQTTRANATVKELHIEPRFSFIPSMAVLAEFHIEGISEAIKKNVRHYKVVL